MMTISKKMYPNTALIVVGAGKGKRLGAQIPKAFISINKKPLIFYTLESFRNIRFIKETILVLRKEDIGWAKTKFGEKLSTMGIKKIVPGGKERQDSVYNGLKAINKNCDIVMIHDAARPFVKKDWLYSLCGNAARYGSAILAIPVEDTIKFVTKGKSKLTLNREPIWRAQTPQAFRTDILLQSYKNLMRKNLLVTDDSQTVEITGLSPKIIKGSKFNIKITTKEDLYLAKILLSRRKQLEKFL